MLVIQELQRETKVWQESRSQYNRLLTLEFIRAEIFRGLDSECTEPPDVKNIREAIRRTVGSIDKAHNAWFGSMFRTGSKQTFFSKQVERYADLYTANFLNLLNYPLFYYFYASARYLPHEVATPFSESLMDC